MKPSKVNLMSDNEEENVVLVFRKRDVRKIADFCSKNNILVAPYRDNNNKVDWTVITHDVLNSPVIMKGVDALIQYMDNKTTTDEGEKYIDAEYEEINDTEDNKKKNKKGDK